MEEKGDKKKEDKHDAMETWGILDEEFSRRTGGKRCQCPLLCSIPSSFLFLSAPLMPTQAGQNMVQDMKERKLGEGKGADSWETST